MENAFEYLNKSEENHSENKVRQDEEKEDNYEEDYREFRIEDETVSEGQKAYEALPNLTQVGQIEDNSEELISLMEQRLMLEQKLAHINRREACVRAECLNS